MLRIPAMPSTDSPPERAGQNWKTVGITLGLIVLGAACVIPLGISAIFWVPMAIVVALSMWFGWRRRDPPPPTPTVRRG
jgi:hypothetical protein